MKKFAAVLLGALMLCTSALAQTREEVIGQLIKAQGLEVMFDQQLKQSESFARQVADDVQAQIGGTGALTPAQSKRYNEATQRFFQTIVSAMSAKDMTALWAKLYAKDLSDEELKQMLAYYESPIGKKDIAAQQAAMPMFTQQSMEIMQTRMKSATQVYMQEVADIVGASAKGKNKAKSKK